jgi:hypothetical protein
MIGFAVRSYYRGKSISLYNEKRTSQVRQMMKVTPTENT